MKHFMRSVLIMGFLFSFAASAAEPTLKDVLGGESQAEEAVENTNDVAEMQELSGPTDDYNRGTPRSS